MYAERRSDPALWEEGTRLPAFSKEIQQETINRYARASKDFNPIHIDEDFARKTPLGGTVAHGMLILAYVSEMMTAAFGMDWVTTGKLNVRFRSPARPGDTLTVGGQITRIETVGDKAVVHCDVLCQNQSGEALITGNASVELNRCPPSRQ